MAFGWFKKDKKEPAKKPAAASGGAVSEEELTEELHARIKDLCASGDQHASDAEFAAALAVYWQAFDLLPQPSDQWDAGTWILAAIGDANFLGGDFVAVRDNLTTAMHFPNAVGNSFIHLRLGQCQFELGNLDRAADELARAYMGAGAAIFSQEDPRYFSFLKTRLDPPASGQW